MYAPSDCEQSLLMKAFAETFNECVFSEYIHIYTYISTQKMQLRVNVSA